MGVCMKKLGVAPILFSVILASGTVAFGQEISVLRNSDDWMYSESRPGLRQAGQPVPVVGELFYRRKPVPLRIAKEGVRLTVDVGTFRYSEREDLESSGGWLLADDRVAAEAGLSDTAITQEEISTGFYGGDFAQMKKNTPANWVFVEVPGENGSVYWTKLHLAYWVDPEKLEFLTDCWNAAISH